jgi:hypothetical protein
MPSLSRVRQQDHYKISRKNEVEMREDLKKMDVR